MPVRKPQGDNSPLDLFECLWSDSVQSLKDFVNGIEPCFQNDHLRSKLGQRVVLPDWLLLGIIQTAVVQPDRRFNEVKISFLNAPFHHLLIFAVEYEQTILVHDFQLPRRI